jgi:hypothetical protein
MLVRTLGLIQTVGLLHPRVWVAGLMQAEEERREDAWRKEQWWELARRVAAWLREHAGAQRVGIIGALLHPQPLDYWSQLSLVVWGVNLWDFETYRDIRALDRKGVVDLVDPRRPRREEREAIEKELVEIE